MIFKNPIKSIVLCSILVVSMLYAYTELGSTNSSIELISNNSGEVWSSKKAKVKAGQEAFAKPDGYIEYFNNVSKRIGEETSSYKDGYRQKELNKALTSAKNLKSRNVSAVEFISRGPGNVGGRTRAIAIDPTDNCIWIAGASSGGLWKTTDCGDTWTNISPEIPNLSTNSIAQAASNPDVIYVGTGEVFAGNTSFVRGDGIYKSTDRGATWNLLPATVNNNTFLSVNRIAVSPTDENVLVIVTNTGIYKSTDGGANWIENYKSATSVQDLQVDPTNYSIQYAAVNGLGIFKSTDAGDSWVNSSAGISSGGRFEIAVAPSDENIVYTSTYAGDNTLLYYSDNKGATWSSVSDDEYNTNFLYEQGWYDNTIEVNPYNPYEVFVGGVSVGKFNVDPADVSVTDPQFLGVDQVNTDFLTFFAFNATYNGGTLNISDGSLSPSDNPVNVEIRWGGANQQKAHRFSIPANGGTNGDGGAGVPLTNFTYEDYIDVPFEVWDIENNRQLMVSFRDQQNNGVFNLNVYDEANDPSLLVAREYLYIHDIAYDETTPSTEVTTTAGGIQFANMYWFWPLLTEGATWDPATFTDAVMTINYGTGTAVGADGLIVSDARGDYGGKNSNLHADHHHLTFIKTDEANETFMIVNGNDGGLGLSTDNGETFKQITSGYITTQFYGADKKPGEDKFVGGTQDNGTWVYNGSDDVTQATSYTKTIGGDGFEVIWHATDPNKVMGSIYNNRIYKSTDGGTSFTSSSTGIASDDGPFITRLASSVTSPEVVYAIGAAGVYKSTNFGGSWTMKTISAETWDRTNSSSADVEVSLANDQIVWAGAAMRSGTIDIFVSENAGNNWNPVAIPASGNPGAFTTGIYTHPKEENTAYILFSVPGAPKIYKTTDLGQTWSDISGFISGGGTSDNGFPDVLTHSLLVMPYNTDIIWAGTEIGLFESLDGGVSWNIRTDLPAVSIWSMKIVDDQVVLGTHGRGIWTATITELAPSTLNLSDFTYNGFGKATVSADLPVAYERIEILVDDVSLLVDDAPVEGLISYDITGFTAFAGSNIKLIGTYNGENYENVLKTELIDVAPTILSATSPADALTATYPITITLENNEPFNKAEVYINGNLVYTDEQTVPESDTEKVITFNYDKAVKTSNLEVVSFINGLEFSSLYTELLVTSNRDELSKLVKVYPNPVVNVLSIDKTETLKNIKIYTSAGKLIYVRQLNKSVQNMAINFSNFEEGLYLVQIENNQGVISTKRVIKN